MNKETREGEEGVRTHRSDGSPFVGEVVEEEDEPLLTLNEVKDRFVGIVDNARAAGLGAITSRGFAAVESFLGALAGDKDEKRPKR